MNYKKTIKKLTEDEVRYIYELFDVSENDEYYKDLSEDIKKYSAICKNTTIEQLMNDVDLQAQLLKTIDEEMFAVFEIRSYDDYSKVEDMQEYLDEVLYGIWCKLNDKLVKEYNEDDI